MSDLTESIIEEGNRRAKRRRVPSPYEGQLLGVHKCGRLSR